MASAEPRRSDFQPTTEVSRYFDRAPVSLPRLVLRLVVLLAVLVAFDVWVGRSASARGYDGAYRLPLELPTAALPGYVHALDGQSQRALFLGASPTWGYRIRDPRHTYPYSYASAAASAGVEIEAANLAANGQLLGDQYLLAKALVRRGDVVFVQLTYHMFDPTYERGRQVRYPEIASLPGVGVSASEAKLLGVPEQAAPAAGSAVSRVLFDRWAAYRERSAIASRLFGGVPEQRLRDAWVRRTGGKVEPEARAVMPEDEFASFDSLDPEKQMIVIADYADNSAFDVRATEPQMRTLRLLAQLLRDRGAKAVFYIAPLNRDIIDYYALIEREQYLANTKRISAVVRGAGFPFVDYNAAETPLFPAEYFADIDHTTDAGGRAVGERLWRDTAAYVAARAAGRPAATGTPAPAATP